MIRLIIFLFISSSLISQESDWKYLFDGSSLEGWHQFKSNKMSEAWYIEDGELVLNSNNDNISRGNDILYEKEFWIFRITW